MTMSNSWRQAYGELRDFVAKNLGGLRLTCVQSVIIYQKAGADVINPDVNINRNLGLLKEIKEAANARLKLLVIDNELKSY